MENNLSDNQKFNIQEVKDYLSGLNEAIHRTREKSWQILGVELIWVFYLLQDFILKKDCVEHKVAILIGISSISFIVILFHLWGSLFPSKIFPVGITAKNIKLIESNPDILNKYDAIISTYDKSISDNKEIHIRLTRGYKKGFNTILWQLGISVGVFIIWFFLTL